MKTNCWFQPFRHHHILKSTCQFIDFKECFLSHRRCALRWMGQRNRKAAAFSQAIRAMRWEPRAGLRLPAPGSKQHHHRYLCPALLSHHPSDGGRFCTQLQALAPVFIWKPRLIPANCYNIFMIQQYLCKAAVLALDSSDPSLPKYVTQ